MSTYTYSLSGDFGGSIKPGRLRKTIEDEPSITITLSRIEVDGDDVNTIFVSALSGAEQIVLDGLISGHDSSPDPVIEIDTDGSYNTTTTIKSSQTGNRTVTLFDADDTIAGVSVSQTFTNKKMVASSTDIVDNVDATKKICFDVGSASASSCLTLQGLQTGNRTITFPDADDTVLGETTSQTASNKDFIDSSVNFVDNVDSSKKINFSVGGANASTTTTILCSQTGNRTFTIPDATTTAVGVDNSQSIANKTFDADLNTITNIDNAAIKAGAAIDATKLADGSVSNTELQYINTLTSNAQTQLNAKATSSHTHDWDDATGNVDVIPFNTGAGAPAHAEGKVFYDDGEHTLAVYNDESDVTHQLGQEGYIRVYNNSGSTINNGHVVYVSGNEGVENRPTVALARCDSKSTSGVIGFATHDIENNTFGYVTSWGLVNDLDTSAFAAGDIIYLSETTAGGFRANAPPEGNYKILLGYIIKSHATTGRILSLVHPDLGLPGGDANVLTVDAQKGSAGTINAGQVVYITGYNPGNDLIEVEIADSSSASTMPAFGIARDSFTNSSTGIITVLGKISNQNTVSYSVGDNLYISETAGELTNVKPTGSALIQKIGQVTRSHSSQGVIEIFGAGRSNDLPNLTNTNFWMGNGSGVPTETTINSLTADATPDGTADYVMTYDASASQHKKVLLDNLPGGGGGVTDHGALTGLTDDDHTQYLYLNGRSGGQTIIGGNGPEDHLELRSTSNVGYGTIKAIHPIRCDEIDCNTTAVFQLGKSVATKVEIAKTGLVTEVKGNLDVLEGLDVTGNLTVTGNVDGRDVAADGTAQDAHIAATAAHGVAGSIIGTTDVATLTSKTIDADLNTITNIADAEIKAGAAIDATKIGSGSVSNTEFGYLNGVSSAIQTQIDNKTWLVALSDTVISAPADNEVIAWNNASSKWINQTAAEAGLATSSHAHTASDVTSGTFDDARIAASNVTQHEGSITITNLSGAPSGAVVGISDTQTLTYKTISSSTNTVGANDLRTTGASVVIDTAAPPTSGQVLTATSATAANWQAAGTPTLPTTTKGDVIVHNGSTDIRLGVGTNGQILTADSGEASGVKWVDSDLSAALQIRRTTAYTTTVTYTDITFNTTDVETDNTVLEHDNTNTDRITLIGAGTYKIEYNSTVDADESSGTLSMRMRVNDTTVLNGSITDVGIKTATTDVSKSFIYEATANDYITLQANHVASSMDLTNMTINVVKLDGIQGPAGAAGIAGADGDMTWQGDWVSGNYVVNQAVSYNGSSYVCHTNTVSNEVPTNTSYWDILASKGDAGAPGGGETNTASNVGTGGVGVFKQKTGVDLEFKKINSGSGVSITDDTGNDEVDVALDINGLISDATPDGAADYVVTYDASATSHKKVLLNNLPGGGGSLTTSEITATTNTSTTSTSYVQMNSMTTTPASGTYLVSFSASGNLSNASNNALYSIYSGGTKVAHSERQLGWGGGGHASGFDCALHTQTQVTVNGSQAVAVYFLSGGTTFTVHERSMHLLKLS